jgi:hypothetical protein
VLRIPVMFGFGVYFDLVLSSKDICDQKAGTDPRI